MTNNLLTIEVDAELVSEVRVKELQNESEKAQWLAERYFEVREH